MRVKKENEKKEDFMKMIRIEREALEQLEELKTTRKTTMQKLITEAING